MPKAERHVNRTDAKARHLALSYDAHAATWSDLPEALAAADLVITCTGAAGRIIGPELAARVAGQRAGRGQVYVDLGRLVSAYVMNDGE